MTVLLALLVNLVLPVLLGNPVLLVLLVLPGNPALPDPKDLR